MPELPIVVVDTNQIAYGPWRLESVGWRLLLHRSRAETIRLVVPEIVVMESVFVFRRALVEALGALDHAHDGLRSPLPTIRLRTPRIDVQEATERYEDDLRTRLADADALVIEPSSTDLYWLVKRAAERIPPFNPNGGGFRDSAIWLSGLGALVDHPTAPLVLVTSDKAFFEGGDLKPQLQDEALRCAASSATAHRTVLGAVVSLSGSSSGELLGEVERAFTKSRRAAILRSLRRALVGASRRSEDGQFAVEVQDAREIEFEIGHVIPDDTEEAAIVELMVLFAADAIITRFTIDGPSFSRAHSGPLRASAVLRFDRDRRSSRTIEIRLPDPDSMPAVARWRRDLVPMSAAPWAEVARQLASIDTSRYDAALTALGSKLADVAPQLTINDVWPTVNEAFRNLPIPGGGLSPFTGEPSDPPAVSE